MELANPVPHHQTLYQDSSCFGSTDMIILQEQISNNDMMQEDEKEAHDKVVDTKHKKHLPCADDDPLHKETAKENNETSSAEAESASKKSLPFAGIKQSNMTIVLELDQCLITTKKVKRGTCLDSFKTPGWRSFAVYTPDDHEMVTHVWERPHLREFLLHASQRYRLQVFTRSPQSVSDAVMDQLEDNQPGKYFERRLYRQHLTCLDYADDYAKDLSKYFPSSSLDRVVLVDHDAKRERLQPKNGYVLPRMARDDTGLQQLWRDLYLMDQASTVPEWLSARFGYATEQRPDIRQVQEEHFRNQVLPALKWLFILHRFDTLTKGPKKRANRCLKMVEDQQKEWFQCEVIGELQDLILVHSVQHRLNHGKGDPRVKRRQAVHQDKMVVEDEFVRFCEGYQQDAMDAELSMLLDEDPTMSSTSEFCSDAVNGFVDEDDYMNALMSIDKDDDDILASLIESGIQEETEELMSF